MLRRNFARLGQLAFLRLSSSAAPASKPSMWSIGKYFIVKPFVYASVYSASTAALSLALLSAPQLAAAPLVAKAAVVLANSSAAFGVGSAHGSLNGAHQLLINDRMLSALLPMGQVFDFLKSKNTKRLDMEASKAVAAKIKDSLLDPKFIPRVLRPAAGFVVELLLPVSTICAIPEHIEKNLAVSSIAQLQEQDASLLGMEAVLHAFILAAASQALTSKKEAVVMWGCGAVLLLSCATLGSVAWWYKPRL